MAQSAVDYESFLARALVRVLDRSADPVGFGLLVAADKVVTCSHVVAMSMGEQPSLAAAPSRERVLLDFPFLAPGRIVTAEVSAWQARAEDGSGDVAGLVLAGAVPSQAAPVALTRGGNVGGHDFQAYGYRPSSGASTPTWVPGRIVERTEGGLLQLGMGELTGGLRIWEGFSGTPVWDVQYGQVIGLITAGVRSRRGLAPEWLAYAVSGETIFDAWPELRESFERACPFRSLVPFTSADSDVFFGRDQLAGAVVDRITRSEHMIIGGASGAGKTSLMNAKVIPELESQGYAVLAIPTGEGRPLWRELAAAVAAKTQPEFGAEQLSTETQLTEAFAAETVRSRVARLCAALGNDRVVVVADQYEQLLRESPSRAGEFTWELGQLPTVRHPEGRPRVRVVIVLREDHEAELRGLPPYDACASTAVHVGPLTLDQLRAAVEEPVRKTGFARYEATLVDRIIDEVHVQPYSLPALQVVLTELWDRMSPDGLLRHSVYQELSQGAGPLATALERKWNELGKDAQAAALRLLLHLVIPVGDDGFARRAASQTEIGADDWQIAGALATQRLIVLRDSPAGGAVAELVHDALIDQWPMLAGYLRDHRDFLQWRDDLRRRLVAWGETNRQPSQLLSGGQLEQALGRLQDRSSEVSDREREYLLLSKQRQSVVRRRRRIGIAAAFSIIIIAVGAVLVAVSQFHSRQLQTRIALSRQAAADSGQLLGTNLAVAQLLAVEAYHIDENPQTLAALFQAVTYSPSLVRYLQAGSPVSAVYGSADGRVVVAGTSTGRVVRWQVSGGPGDTIAKLQGAITAVASNADGSVIAAVAGSEVVVWTPAHGAKPAQIPHGTDVGAIAVSPAGRYVAVGAAADNGLTLLDRYTERARTIRTNFGGFLAMPSDRSVVLASGGGPWEVFSAPALTHVLGPTDLGTGVHQVTEALSTNGAFFAYSNGGATIPIWSTSRLPGLAGAPNLTGRSHGSDPQALSISPDGKRVAVADGGVIYVSGTSRGTRPSTAQLSLPGNGSTRAIQFLGDDDHLVSATGNSLALWNLGQHSRIATTVKVAAPYVCEACAPPQVDMSPNGKLAAILAGNPPTIFVHGLGPRAKQYAIHGGLMDSYQLLGWNSSSNTIFAIKDGSTFEAVRLGNGARILERRHIPPSDILAFSPASKELIAVTNARRVQIISLAGSIRSISSPIPSGDAVGRSLVDPSESYLAEQFYSAKSAEGVALINLKTGMSRIVETGKVATVAFSTGYLLIQRANGEMDIWNSAGTILKYQIHEDQSYLPSAASVQSNPVIAAHFLVQERSNRTLAVTQLGTRELLAALPIAPSSSGLKTGLSVDDRDRQLVSVTQSAPLKNNGSLTRWDLSPQSWIKMACVTAGRSLTPSDWQRYVTSSVPGYLACGH